MDIHADPQGFVVWPGGRARCAFGRGGIARDKREGDGATPVGCFLLREVFYRPDRGQAPKTALPVATLDADAGWCDDPAHPKYNRPVRLPFTASHERMWRDDALYDIVVVLGYNDDPIMSGRGSAIFLHVARENYAPTEGCVALAREDLEKLLADCGPGDRLCVKDPAAA